MAMSDVDDDEYELLLLLQNTWPDLEELLHCCLTLPL